VTVDVDGFRRRLQDERERVVAAIDNLHQENPGSMQDEVDESSLDNHLAETATVTIDREIDYSLEENSEQILKEIDDALLRIEDGTYGICTNCGKPIAEERLEAAPWVTLCIDCKREEEAR
jgi:RNA polymerase-binding protein DksA